MKQPFVTSYLFGHEIYLELESDVINKDWRYVDNNCLIEEDTTPRRCPKCGQLPTKDGHDPCIANLPGVAYACCGHGVEEGYVKFFNGVVVTGKVQHGQPVDE
jgi:hypothetical protein